MEEKRDRGIGMIGILTLIFIVLKQLNLINWSWIWVLSPIWILALFKIIFCSLFIIPKIIRKKK